MEMQDHLQQLIKCAEVGNMQELLSLIIEDADYSITDQWGGTLLHHAAVNKTTTEIITHLLSKGVPIDVRSKDGRTPVHECASRGNLRNMALLVEAGADIHARDDEERTALHFAARNNHDVDIVEHLDDVNNSTIVDYLIQRGLEVDARDKRGQTPLFYSASRGSLQNMQSLIANGADLRAVAGQGRTVFHAAVTNQNGGEIIQFLLDNNFDVNEVTEHNKTPLLICAHLGNIANMKLLLDNGANILARDKNGCSALHAAASNRKDARIVGLLIERGIEINYTTDDGATALHFAAANSLGGDIVNCLIENGATLDHRTRRGRTPFHDCVSRGNLRNMTLLVEAGADIHVKDDEGRTALHYAAQRDDSIDIIEHTLDLHISSAAIIEYLIQRGMAVEVRDKKGKTPLLYCASHSDLQNMRLLIENGADLRARGRDGRTALHAAVTNEKGGEIIQFLLDNDFFVDGRAEDGKTPLIYCAWLGNISNMQLLLSNGANVQVRDKNGLTALHAAAFNERGADMINLLIERGISVNTVTNDGATALHLASRNSTGFHIVDCLLNHGAAPDDVTRTGRTALHFCASGANVNIMRLLLDNGADVLARDRNGTTAFHVAASNEEGIEMVDLLIEMGIPVNSRTNENATPLHFACGNPAGYHIVESLLRNGASLQARRNDGRTALLSCAFGGSLKMMQLLLEHGANIQDRDAKETTALHAAAFNERGAEMIDFIIERGIPVNSTADEGKKPLYFAAGNPAGYDIVKCLLKHGASPGDRIKSGRTALHSCARSGNLQIMKLLLEAGCTIDAVNTYGFGVLHSAAERKSGEEMIEFLLEKGIAVDALSGPGITPLHLSCQAGNLRSVQLLLARGADPNPDDRSNRQRARDFVKVNTPNRSEILNLLDGY